ncbi:MAG: chloride channel protein [Clostridia bacterium]|nr:chloride channel protein [Clostridia bacterium]
MDCVSNFKKPTEYILNLFKWSALSILIGAVCALAGALFHYAVDIGLHARETYPQILFALPFAGIVIVFLYHVCGMDEDRGTNAILQSVRTNDKISVRVAPLILVATALTHLCGGSSGREGAALQIGGSIGSSAARKMNLKNYTSSVLIMCGMSGLFSAVFGTPLAAAVFALEVVSVGIMHYGALFPALMSAISAQMIAQLLGVEKTAFTLSFVPEFEALTLLKVLALSLLVALLSIVFITLMHETGKFAAKYFKNRYLRIVVGSILIILLTVLVGNQDYNGAGMNIIVNAVENGNAAPGAFLLKMIFTAITLSVGFKGGEIVPTFFIGSTFGVLVAPMLGLNPSFASAIALIALYCGVVNCPVASINLSVELFGSEGLLYFALASAVSYFFSGNYSLYSSQKMVFSKLRAVIEEQSN